MPILHEEFAHEQHQYEAWQHHGKRSDEASEHSPSRGIAGIDQRCVANVGCAVDTDRPWRALANGHYVGELPHCHPMIVPYHLTLYHGYHGIASSETEKADEEEGPEKLKKERNHKGYGMKDE